MIKNVFRKGLVIGIIILFIGTSVIPSISGNIGKINYLPSAEEISLNTFDPDLIAWWSFDEGSGQIANDYSGNGNDGTIYGATWTTNTPCVEGYALDFDGENDYVSISSKLIPTGAKTITAWINPQTHDNDQGVILGNGNMRMPNDGFDFFHCSDSARRYIKIKMDKNGVRLSDATSSVNSVPLSIWSFVAVTWDGTTNTNSVKMYVNGEVDGVDTPSDTDVIGDYNAVIGKRSELANWKYMFDGVIDEIRVYNQELSENEIEYLYNNPGNQPPTAIIDSIVPNPALYGKPVTFFGHGEDLEGTIIGYNWRSSIDGQQSTQASFITSALTQGTHTIYFKVKDNCNKWSDEVTETLLIVENQPPNKPDTPSGSTAGKTGVSYTYSSSSTDPNDDQLHYWFDWGDGTNSGWVGPYNSGQTVSEAHIWNITGTFPIKVKAKDIFDEESVWSDPLIVRMPRNRAINSHLFLRFLERFPILQKILCFIL